MSDDTSQPEVLQEISDEWKHRTDKPEPTSSTKSARGKRGKAATKDSDTPAEAEQEGTDKT